MDLRALPENHGATQPLWKQDIVCEFLHEVYGQFYKIKRIVYNNAKKAVEDGQWILIIETERHGIVLLLDGIVQFNKFHDEYHVPFALLVLLLKEETRGHVAIVGGGDLILASRVLQIPGVEKVTVIEIDPIMIELAQTQFTDYNNFVADDDRLSIEIVDAAAFMALPGNIFDAMLVDRSDPVGPNGVLYSRKFYADCKNRLHAHGFFAAMSGVPNLQINTLENDLRLLGQVYESDEEVSFSSVNASMYPGGDLALSIATREGDFIPSELLQTVDRWKGYCSEHWNPLKQLASFDIPIHLRTLLPD